MFLGCQLAVTSIPIELDKEESFGPAHFIMMGLNPGTNGGFLEDDVTYTYSQPTDERTQADTEMIRKRLEDYGPAGLLEHLEKKLADGFYLDCCRRARMLALTNWSMYPHMTECWEKLNAEVFTSLKERPPLFIDLVDPSSRTETDISRMLQTVSRFEQNTQTILGLNGVEANVIARVLRIPEAKENPTELSEQAAALQKKLDIDTVVIHCVKLAAMANADGSVAVAGPYCPNPKKSTGAGDRFNAGFCTGVLLGLTPREKLLLGSACSGFFVREARSASAEELSQFIKEWSLGKI